MKTFIRDTIITVALAIVVYLGLRLTIEDRMILETSMLPTFQEGQRILVNKVIYRFSEPQRGDVVIIKPPDFYVSKLPFIKRVIGLPGDTVDIREGYVFITRDGQTYQLDESYIKEKPLYTYHIDEVPAHEYFVLGDNRNISFDSHRGWTVPRSDIIGKAWFSIWPPAKWGFATNYNLGKQVAALFESVWTL